MVDKGTRLTVPIIRAKVVNIATFFHLLIDEKTS